MCSFGSREKGETLKTASSLLQDTALGFNAMGGLPGAYIKHFLGNLGHEGKCDLSFSTEDLR
jgi:inosine triphosphate pyrophosphatase